MDRSRSRAYGLVLRGRPTAPRGERRVTANQDVVKSPRVTRRSRTRPDRRSRYTRHAPGRGQPTLAARSPKPRHLDARPAMGPSRAARSFRTGETSPSPHRRQLSRGAGSSQATSGTAPRPRSATPKRHTETMSTGSDPTTTHAGSTLDGLLRTHQLASRQPRTPPAAPAGPQELSRPPWRRLRTERRRPGRSGDARPTSGCGAGTPRSSATATVARQAPGQPRCRRRAHRDQRGAPGAVRRGTDGAESLPKDERSHHWTGGHRF